MNYTLTSGEKRVLDQIKKIKEERGLNYVPIRLLHFYLRTNLQAIENMLWSLKKKNLIASDATGEAFCLL